MWEDFESESPEPSTLVDTGKELRIRKPVRPYVCTTPGDFDEEVAFLAEKIYPQLVEVSLQRGAYFSPVHIRWKLEDGIYQDGQLLRLLLDYIHKCAPFLICLLGECYGPYRSNDQPPLNRRFHRISESLSALEKNYMVAASAGYDWVLDQAHQYSSLTELELIQAAFLADSEHCNFYFRQAEHLDFKFAHLDEKERESASARYVEQSEHAGLKIWDLKQRIVKKGLPVKYFKTLSELGNLVLDDWKTVIDLLYPPLENLEHFIDTEDYAEWMAQESYAENLRAKFISTPGLEALMESLSEFALSVTEDGHMDSAEVESFPKYRNYSASSQLRKRHEEVSGNKSVMILHGERGSGKSTVVSKWLKMFHDDYPHVKVIHHFASCSRHSTDIEVFLLRCIKQLRKHFLSQDSWSDFPGETSSSNKEDQPTNFRESCEAFLAAVSLGPCVLVLDGIDSLGSTLSLSLQEVKEFLWLPATLPQSCRVIVTTTRSDLSYRHLSKRTDTQTISLPSLASDSLKTEFLQEYMKHHYSHISRDYLQQILGITLTCRPMFLSVLSAEMQCFGVYMNMKNFVEDNLEVCSVREFWTKCLQRWTLDYSWQLEDASSDENINNDKAKEFEYVGWICDALALIALSRNGLLRIEIMQLLKNMGYTDELEVSHYDWLQFRSCLGHAVYDKADGLIDFSNQYLKEIVEYVILRIVKSSASDSSGKSEVQSEWSERKRRIHIYLAEFFCSRPQSQRRLQELPWQLMMAGDHDALLGFVTHIDYMLLMMDETGKFPGNRHDLVIYWTYLSNQVGVDVGNTYHQLLVRIGLLESGLKHLQPVMLTEVPEDGESDDSQSEQHSPYFNSGTVPVPQIPVIRCTQQLSVIEEGHSDAEDRLSQQSSAVRDKDDICISDKGLVTSLAWHISQLLLELGQSEMPEKILTGLVQYLTANFPLNCNELLAMAECQEVLGNIHHAHEDIRHAESCYRRALQIVLDLQDRQDESLDSTRLSVLKSRLLGHHGSIRLSEGELVVAEDLLKESLESLEACPGHVTLRASILYHLGVLRHKQGDLLRAEACLRQSLIIRGQWFGKSHPLVADVLVALARLLSTTNNNKGCDKVQAEHLYSRAIDVREQCLPANHLLTAEILYELGCLVGEQPSYSAKMESIRLLRKALDIRTTRLGGDHPETKAARQYLTQQEVLLRMGQYEFGPAKPTDTRTNSNPYSNLSFRDKDLNTVHKRQQQSRNKQGHYDRDSVPSVTREDLLKHNRPLSIMGSSASIRSPSEKLLQDSERPKLLRRGSMEKQFQRALAMGKHAPLLESYPSSLTSDSSIRRLTVDLTFVGSTADDEHRDQSTLLESNHQQIDSYAPELSVRSPKSPKKSPVRSRIDTRPMSAPLRLFVRYGSASTVKSNKPDRAQSANFARHLYSVNPRASSCFTSSSEFSHKSNCDIPGPHTIHVSNTKSITGPHSSIYSLLDKAPLPRDMKRTAHHQSAWYHMKGHYPTRESPVPPKRSQHRPSSRVESPPKTNPRQYAIRGHRAYVFDQSAARAILTNQSEKFLKPEDDETAEPSTEKLVAVGSPIVSFKQEALIVG